ncbi:MAG: hypothetical protein VKL20_04900 [Synechocystis sp.]|nr:hypothetical protein [Synechocystis sp.]
MTPWTIWFKPAEAETWQTLELYRSLPTGHYRVAARLPRPFKRLAWRWKFYPQVGDIQYYDFHGQTNAEGLISLLELNTIKPGTWQLIGRPDVFDELCGETWQIDHQFQIIPNLAAALIIPPLIPSPVSPETAIATDIDPAANEIVPHPSETAAMIHEQRLVAANAEAENLENPGQADGEASLIERVQQPETSFNVLAEPDFVPEEEILNDTQHFHPVNYVFELIDPEKAATYHVDITVMQDDRRLSVPLDLPNPRQMVRLLHRPIPKPKSPLPPKLSKV